MKITPRIAKIARIALWSTVAVLMLFITFMYGGSYILGQISNECTTSQMFLINEQLFECKVVPIGVLS